MKSIYTFTGICLVAILVSSCSSSKTYFTPAVRARIEHAGVNVEKLQFYIDHDVKLVREVSQEEGKLSKGKVTVVNGKLVNIINLSKNTAGVCKTALHDKVLVSFEEGENRYLTFGRTKYAADTDPYKILAFNWINGNEGVIDYEGQKYHIKAGGDAAVKIKTKFVRKADRVKERDMKGQKVSS